MSEGKRNFFADKDIQLVLGTLLRVGVITSMTIVLVGGLIYLFLNHANTVDYVKFDSGKSRFSSITAIFNGLMVLDGAAIIQFGVMLLIFTPIARVIFSVFSFLIEGDYRYVLIGLMVLTIILYSLSDKLVG